MRVVPVEGRRRPFGLRAWLIVGAAVLVILLLSLRGLARFYTDYLWFKDVGFAHTWRALLSAKIVPALIFAIVFFVFMVVNLVVADREHASHRWPAAYRTALAGVRRAPGAAPCHGSGR